MDKKPDQKKIAAAMAAVFAYIKTGEEMAAAQMQGPAEIISQGGAQPGPPMNLWGITGRQAVMQAGSMMQMRMFK